MDEACRGQALTSTLAIHAQGEWGGGRRGDKHKTHNNNDITITQRSNNERPRKCMGWAWYLKGNDMPF
jgi:hypothetical protein